ncbi:MAG: hypothetical protein M3228_09555 [Actinomycetota bacterium]|nr:hypothetical protein [Actinomycetota bacterium]
MIKGHWALLGRVAAPTESPCSGHTDNGRRGHVPVHAYYFKRLPTVAAEATRCHAAKQAAQAVPDGHVLNVLSHR